MSGIKIRGTGRFAPAKIVTNDDLAKIVDTNDEWITTRTGIKTRHHCTTETHTDMCVNAARQALENAGISPEDIGACVVATFSSDYLSPSAACMVQRGLGLPYDAVCFDLNAACSGFLFAIHTMECLLAQAPRKYGLVIGAEMLSRFINWEDRGTCVLFGDGAGAAVLKAEETGIIDMMMGADGTKGDVLACTSRTVGNFLTGTKPELGFMTMDGQEVFKFAVRKVPESVMELLQRTGTKKEDIKYYVLHQANERIIEAAARRLKEPMEKFPMTIGQFGNTSTASIPLLLNDMIQKNMLKRGDKIIMSGFGAGMTWGAVLMEW